MNHSEAPAYLPAFISKMKAEGIQPVVTDTFAHYYKQLISGETGLIYDRDIEPVDSNEIEDATRLNEYADAGRRALKNAVMIVLNGGLGTSMGLTGAKSLLEAKTGVTFLEIIVKRAQLGPVKLSMMNSFSTHEDSLSALSRLNPPDFPLIFNQHRFPKILRDGFAPATWPQKLSLEWNPPGHGDIYTALISSGTLQKLLDDGIIYAFIANSDNLCATMDESLLGYFSENRFPFMMEVSERKPVDFKGGHLAKHKNGKFILRETAQCPANELDTSRDIARYRFFNTNNIWINLHSLRDLFEQKGIFHLPMILNPKTLDPRDESSPPVFQVETAMGTAISLFEGSTVVKVPRSRFFPVKKCNELLALRSDCFVLSEEKHLTSNPDRKFETIRINLDPKYYGKIDLFDERFANGAPSLVACESLTIEGDVYFERNVTIKGVVEIKNRSGSRKIIPEGTVIEQDLIL